jgi:transcriptional regulator with XRE-family HTH domain
MTFGEKLRERRGDLTREELSEKSGVSHSVIRDYELGVRSNPSFNTVVKLANALGCTCQDLKDD